MNREEALNILIKHNQFFEIYVQAKYVPRAMEGTINEIQLAYMVINPGHLPCSTCNDPAWIIDANRYRIAELNLRENNALKQMTFPKHKKNK